MDLLYLIKIKNYDNNPSSLADRVACLGTRAQGRVELGFARTSTFLIFEEQILSMLNLNIKMKKTRVIMEITALVSI